MHRVHVHPLKFDNGCSAPVLKLGSQNKNQVKTYLRNSMGQGRLNHVMFMNVQKEETKKVSLEEVAEEFISKNERRRADFGVKNYI